MPRIYIQGETVPEIVSQDDAERILEQKNDSKHKGMIQVGHRSVPKGRIREVTFTPDSRALEFNLDNPDDKAKVLEFEGMLKKMEDQTLDRELKWYGHPFLNQEKFPGWVLNPVLSGVHWTTVKHALEYRLIVRKSTGAWAIFAHVVGGGMNFTGYLEFVARLDALRDLRSRRAYAKKKEQDELNKVVDEERQKFVDEKSFPSIDMDTENIKADDLPF